MKGIVLAGGTGSRLDPLTRVTNKHLLPVYDRPMVYFSLQLLRAAQITDVLLVVGGRDADRFASLIGDGRGFGLNVGYVHQKRPGGIADALGLAQSFAEGGDVCVLLGDNIFERTVRESVERFRQQRSGARVLIAEVDRPEAYGVPVLANDRVIRIDEKPVRAATGYAVTGCYLYDRSVFDLIGTLSPSARGELEITDLNNAYVGREQLYFDFVQGYWVDCGESFDAYLRAQNLVATRGANR